MNVSHGRQVLIAVMLIYSPRPHPAGTNKAAKLYFQADKIELRCPCPGDNLILAMTVPCEEISCHREKRLNSAPGASGPALGVGVTAPLPAPHCEVGSAQLCVWSSYGSTEIFRVGCSPGLKPPSHHQWGWEPSDLTCI